MKDAAVTRGARQILSAMDGTPAMNNGSAHVTPGGGGGGGGADAGCHAGHTAASGNPSPPCKTNGAEIMITSYLTKICVNHAEFPSAAGLAADDNTMFKSLTDEQLAGHVLQHCMVPCQQRSML